MLFVLASLVDRIVAHSVENSLQRFCIPLREFIRRTLDRRLAVTDDKYAKNKGNFKVLHYAFLSSPFKNSFGCIVFTGLENCSSGPENYAGSHFYFSLSLSFCYKIF